MDCSGDSTRCSQPPTTPEAGRGPRDWRLAGGDQTDGGMRAEGLGPRGSKGESPILKRECEQPHWGERGRRSFLRCLVWVAGLKLMPSGSRLNLPAAIGADRWLVSLRGASGSGGVGGFTWESGRRVIQHDTLRACHGTDHPGHGRVC